MLNYFTTTGQQKKCKGGNYSTDGTYNVAQGCDVRGAYDAADLQRQQAKTVAAINQLRLRGGSHGDRDNSAKPAKNRTKVLAALAGALKRCGRLREAPSPPRTPPSCSRWRTRTSSPTPDH
ncbi:hypothetical protein QJS66_17065 [Kocuria rhizophila]|nr:hypothetical protein QJS66_17065 [Kocuria rhizophila]